MVQMNLRISRILATIADRVFTGAGALSGIAIVVIMIAVIADVSRRGILNQPIAGVYEISEMLMVLIVFFGFALTEARGRHIRVEVLTRRLPSRTQLFLELLAPIIGIFLYGVICIGSWECAAMSWATKEYTGGLVSIPLYPSRFVLSIGCFFVVVRFLISAVHSVFSLFGKGMVEP